MNRIRLLPVVIMVVGALLVLKTVGLVTQGSYALTGVNLALASGGGGEAKGAPAETATLQQPTVADTAPTMADTAPTAGEPPAAAAAGGGHGAPAPAAEHGGASAEGEATKVAEVSAEAPIGGHDAPASGNSVADTNACAPRAVGEGSPEGQLTAVSSDCPPIKDAMPQLVTPGGNIELGAKDPTLTEQVLLDRLAARRTELDTYEQELSMRASLIDAAEKRVNERTATLQALEAQIATLVDERKKLEEDQFTGIVSMYQTMKPKDAAGIFNQIEMDVLLRVAKMMPPRKMAPILAAMDRSKAEALTVALAAQTSETPEQMGQADLAALPQIVGQ